MSIALAEWLARAPMTKLQFEACKRNAKMIDDMARQLIDAGVECNQSMDTTFGECSLRTTRDSVSGRFYAGVTLKVIGPGDDRKRHIETYITLESKSDSWKHLLSDGRVNYEGFQAMFFAMQKIYNATSVLDLLKNGINYWGPDLVRKFEPVMGVHNIVDTFEKEAAK